MTETDSLTEQVQERRCCVSQDLLRNRKPAELLTEDHYKKNVPGGKKELGPDKNPNVAEGREPRGLREQAGQCG